MSYLRNRAPLIVTLESGLVVRLRPIHEGDTSRIRQAYGLLSEESRMNRFWEKPAEIHASRASALADTGDENHFAWIALHETDDSFPGYAGASVWRDPLHPERAEIAFTVADDWQREGLATLLFSILWIEGRELGIREYHGTARLRNLAILHWWEGIGGNIRTFNRHHEFSFPLESPDSFLQKVAYEMPPSPRRVALADWISEWMDLLQSP